MTNQIRNEKLIPNFKTTMIKRCLPKKFKQSVRNTIDLVNFYRSINELKKISRPEDLSTELIRKLANSWGNTGWSLSEQAIKDTVVTSFSVGGPILECGSGISTIILGVLHRNNSEIDIWSLEHEYNWYSKVNTWLKRLKLNNVNLIKTSLVQSDNYDWYDISDLFLPGDFKLIICDGPPGSTRGGRSGAIPEMKEYLNAEFTIFLDDTCRLTESRLINKWSNLDWISFSKIRTEEDFSVITASKKQEDPIAPFTQDSKVKLYA